MVLKGQYTIVALIMTFLTLVFFAILYPLIGQYINILLPQLDPLSATFLQLLPFFIVVGIILSIIFYAIPHKEESG